MGKMKQLNIAYVLLTSSRPLTVQEIMSAAECDRKTVYATIDSLETAGFVTEIIKDENYKKPGSRNLYSCSLRC